MKNSYINFINILSAYVNKKNKVQLSEAINWKELIHLAKIHNLEGIFFTALSNCKISLPEEFAKQADTSVFATIKNSVIQERESEAIFALLNKYKIWHLVTKGYVVKNCYADKELRTMGDTDILVQENDKQRVICLMEEYGYIVAYEKGTETALYKNGVNIEIHTNLLMENMGNGFDYGNYFDSLSKSQCRLMKDGYTYELKENAHLIYLIAHLAKHFFDDGCGIRTLMDVYLYVLSKKELINFYNLRDELIKIKLWDFFNNICNITERYFGKIDHKEYRAVIKDNMSDNLYERVTDYIVSGGVFGFQGHDENRKMLRQPEAINEDKDINNRFKFILYWIFPEYKKIQKHYKWFENKPECFIVIGWLVRIVDNLLNNSLTIFDKLKFLFKKQDVSEEYNMIKEMGLYKKISEE